MSPRLASLILAVVVFATTAALPVSSRVAEAHAELERSSPAVDAVLPRAPALLEIWFTQELFRREGANTITVVGPNGQADDGNVVIDSEDREHLMVGLLPDLPAGAYRVTWTSLSAIDGDSAEGEFTFTIDPDAPEPTAAPTEVVQTPEATPTAGGTAGADATSTPSPGASDGASSSDGASFPAWVLVAIAGIGGATVLGGWALLRGDDGGTGGSTAA